MWRNGKLCIAIIFGFFVCGQIGVFAQDATSDDAYCQSISLCGSAPKEFTLLIDFSQEMINAIRTVGTEGKYAGEYVSPDWFAGEKFSPPQQNVVGKVATNVGQKLDFLLATTAIFTSPQQGGGVKDALAGILTLFKSSVFARDLQRVEALDSAVTQKRYELGLGGGWLKTIRSENLKKFQTIISSYVDKGLLDKNSRIANGAKYNDVTAMAGAIDAALKSFLSVGTTAEFTNFTNGGSAGLNIIFVPATIESMARQYDCARGTTNMCDKTYKNFKENMKRLGKGTEDKVKKSIKTFGDAAKRLMEVFSKTPSSDFTARETQLLNAYNGNQKIKTGVNVTVDNGGIFSKWRSASIDDQTKTTSAVDQSKTATINLQATTTQPFAKRMLERMSPLMEQQKVDLTLVNFSEVKDFSQYFDQLGQKILTIKNIVGSKDKDDSLISQLGQACELQCGGTTKKCR